MKYNILETIVGLLFLALSVALLFTILQRQNKNTQNNYIVYANCDNIDGIITGSDLKIAGVTIGVVSEIILNIKTYSAKVKMSVQENIKIPSDSNFAIESSGLLGNKFIAVSPGISEINLKPEDLVYLKAGINLDSLINQIINSVANKKSE